MRETASFCRGTTHARFANEVEQRVQSNGSFARRTIIFVFAGKARLGAPDTP
jgi:hypothetical protein